MVKISKDELKLIIANPIKYAKSVDTEHLVNVLRTLADAYYNTEKELVSDSVYDKLVDILESIDPDNSFLNEIGAPIKGTKEKVKLPYPMGSLDKYRIDKGDLDKWCLKHKGPYVISDKLDGASAQVYRDDNGKIFMFSRGDGEIGQNISHLIPIVIGDIDMPKNSSVRGELIISKKNFKNINDKKHARGAVAGLVNAKNSVDENVLKYTEFVAYSILHPRKKQLEQMELLEEWGFTTVDYEIFDEIDDEILSNHLKERKKKSKYEIDGIVCVDNSKLHKLEKGYPTYAFAYKIEGEILTTKVVKVVWDVSMDGYIKPKIEIEPVNLGGSTVTYATAFNAKYVNDNIIGPGAKITITKSGDVIPKIVSVLKGAKSGKPDMPNLNYHWNDTGVDIIVDDIDDDENSTSDKIKIKLLMHFFKTIGVDFLRIGLITKLVEEGYTSVVDILTANKKDLYEINGLGKKMVDKIYDEINKAFLTVELHTFMAASHKFGRGLGEKKLIEIVKMYPDILSKKWNKKTMKEKIEEVDGFSTKLSELFVENFTNFIEFYEEINEVVDISRFMNVKVHESDTGSDNESSVNNDNNNKKLFDKKSIVFTGFRDKELEKFIIKNGGKVSGSVSGKTFLVIYKDGEDSNSKKIIDAKNRGINVVSKSQFEKTFM